MEFVIIVPFAANATRKNPKMKEKKMKQKGIAKQRKSGLHYMPVWLQGVLIWSSSKTRPASHF